MVSHVGGEPVLFPDDVPPELIDNQHALSQSRAERPTSVAGTSRLKLVTEANDATQGAPKETESLESPPAATEGEAPQDEPPTPPTKTRHHLRVVK